MTTVRNTWATPSLRPGSSDVAWRDLPAASAGPFALRAANDGSTLFLFLTGSGRETADALAGVRGRGLTVWLDPDGERNRQMGVQVPADDSGVVSAAAWAPARAQVLASTAGLFAVLPAADQHVEAWRGADGAGTVLALVIAPPVAALAGRTTVAVGVVANRPVPPPAPVRPRRTGPAPESPLPVMPPGLDGGRRSRRRLAPPGPEAAAAEPDDARWFTLSLALPPLGPSLTRSSAGGE